MSAFEAFGFEGADKASDSRPPVEGRLRAPGMAARRGDGLRTWLFSIIVLVVLLTVFMGRLVIFILQ